MRLQRSVVADVDRHVVWKHVSDPNCYPEFMTRLERWETVTEGPVGIGITGITMRGRFRLRDAGEGRTKITFRLAYEAPGGLLGLIADRVAARQVGRIMDDTVRRLKDLCEH